MTADQKDITIIQLDPLINLFIIKQFSITLIEINVDSFIFFNNSTFHQIMF